MKSLFLLSVLLVTTGQTARADCVTSDHWSDKYSEKISDKICLNVTKNPGAEKTIMIDTGRYGNFDRIWIEFYDWNGDDQTDWIRVTNYAKQLQDGSVDISFYHGRGELEHMLKQYGTHLEGQKNLKIRAKDYGTCSYDGSYNGLKFNKIRSKEIRQIFALADEMMLFKVVGEANFAQKFTAHIQALLERDVESYPARWTY